MMNDTVLGMALRLDVHSGLNVLIISSFFLMVTCGSNRLSCNRAIVDHSIVIGLLFHTEPSDIHLVIKADIVT
jgi:hypothetical protein